MTIVAAFAATVLVLYVFQAWKKQHRHNLVWSSRLKEMALLG